MSIIPRQNTVAKSVHCKGTGLHSGSVVAMEIAPAPENTGIIFQRTDIKGEKAYVPARYDYVCSTQLGTTLANEHGVKVATIEHLMAALWGCNIDNAIIKLNCEEVPIMDGSSEPFVFLIECAGVQKQALSKRIVEILKPVEVLDGNKYLSVMPADDFSISLEIDFASKVISHQEAQFGDNSCFKRDLCRARTFGFAHEVEKMQSMGLARGGSLNNAIVVENDKVLNEGGLRYQNEFVRHKILDCIGDFNLAGGLFKGAFKGARTGHCLNNKLMRAVFGDKDAWRVLEISSLSAA